MHYNLSQAFTDTTVQRDEFKEWITHVVDALNTALMPYTSYYSYPPEYIHDSNLDMKKAYKLTRPETHKAGQAYSFILAHVSTDDRDRWSIVSTDKNESTRKAQPPRKVIDFDKTDTDFVFAQSAIPQTNRLAQTHILIALHEHIAQRKLEELYKYHFTLNRMEDAEKFAFDVFRKAGITLLEEDNGPRITPLERRLDAPR